MLPSLPIALDGVFPERTDLTDEQRAILALWTFGQFKNRYEEIAAVTHDPQWPWTPWSKGRIYHFVTREGVRVTEERIHERTQSRRERELSYLKEILNTTAKTDVREFLDGLPSESISLLLTSPPYNIGKSYAGSSSSDRMRHQYYKHWMGMIICEFGRILKPGGTAILQSGMTYDDGRMPVWLDMLFYPELREAGLVPVNRIILAYDHGLFPKRRLAGRHETALVFYKEGAEQIFNPNASRTPAKHPGKRRYHGKNIGEIATHPLGSAGTDVWRAPGTDVWPMVAIKHNNPEKTNHPAQFPYEFAKRCVLTYSLPNDDIVCDPFSGSGTTQAVCAATGRNFVGADIAYEEIRTRRLALVKPDTETKLPGVSEESLAVWNAEAKRKDVPAEPITAEEDRELCMSLFADAIAS